MSEHENNESGSEDTRTDTSSCADSKKGSPSKPGQRNSSQETLLGPGATSSGPSEECEDSEAPAKKPAESKLPVPNKSSSSNRSSSLSSRLKKLTEDSSGDDTSSGDDADDESDGIDDGDASVVPDDNEEPQRIEDSSTPDTTADPQRPTASENDEADDESDTEILADPTPDPVVEYEAAHPSDDELDTEVVTDPQPVPTLDEIDGPEQDETTGPSETADSAPDLSEEPTPQNEPGDIQSADDHYAEEVPATERLDTLPFEVDEESFADTEVTGDAPQTELGDAADQSAAEDRAKTVPGGITFDESSAEPDPDDVDDESSGDDTTGTRSSNREPSGPDGENNRRTMMMHSSNDESSGQTTSDPPHNFGAEPAPVDESSPSVQSPSEVPGNFGAEPAVDTDSEDEFEPEPTQKIDPFAGGDSTEDSDDFTAEKTEISPELQPSGDDEELRGTALSHGPSPQKPPGEQHSTDHGPKTTDGESIEPTDDSVPPPGDSTPGPSSEAEDNAHGSARPPEQSAPTPEQHDGVSDIGAAGEAPEVDDGSDQPSPGSQEKFEADDTELFQSPYENEPICPRLTALEGPATGQEFLLDQLRNSVGRATSNTVVIPDMAMSRRHFEIIQNPDESYEIHDLMAVNGTTLNGIDVKEADLFHGDRIEAGKTVFQFVIPGQSPVDNRERRLVEASSDQTRGTQQTDGAGEDAENASASTFDKILMGVTITAGLLCIPLIGILIHATMFDDPEAQPPAASELYFEGVDALQSAQWERAEQLFEESHRTDPDFGEVEAQLARIERERNAHRIITTARQQIDEGLDDETLDELRDISRQSHYYDDARSLMSLARQDEVQRIFERASDAYANEEFDKALRALDELQAVAPEHEQAGQLQKEIEETLQQHRKDSADDNGGSSADSTPRRGRSRPESDESALDDPFVGDGIGDRGDYDGSARNVGINFTDGFTMYRSEDFEGAIDHFETIADSSGGTVAERADQTAEDIRIFARSIEEGTQARQDGLFDVAIEAFRTARQADERVAGYGGSFDRNVADQMAKTLAARGHAQLERQEYSSAFKSYDRAVAYGEEHPQVHALGELLEVEAHSLYIRAANKRKSDPEGAAELGETILMMVPPNTEVHQRGQQLLDALD